MTKQSHDLTVAERTQTYLLGIVHFGQVTKDNNIKNDRNKKKKKLTCSRASNYLFTRYC